jgi:hypothetical protein
VQDTRKKEAMEQNRSPFPTSAPTDHYVRSREKPTYPWTFLFLSRALVTSWAICLSIITVSFVFYRWYVRTTHDTNPMGPVGLGFAILALGSFVLAAGGYSLRRRQPYQRINGQLNALLQWHVALALLSLVFAAMHSFGQTEKLSGTLSLYSLALLVMSGWIGRFLDRLLPRLIAQEVNKALTERGDDVLASVARQHSQGLRLPKQVRQTVVRGQIKALNKEQTYRLVLRLWRRIHITLALVTIGLISWHLVYAAQVMFFNK